MAIAYVNSGTGRDYSGPTSAALTAAATSLTAGNAIIVAARFFDTTSTVVVSSVTDTAGNTYGAGPAKLTSGGAEQLIIWFALNTLGHASNVVSVNLSAAVQFWGVVTAQYSDLATASAYDTTANATSGGGTMTTGAFTTDTADELLFAVAQVAGTGRTWTPTAGGGYTIRAQDADNVTVVQDKIVSAIQTGVTTSIDCSDGVTAKSMLVATFKAAAGGGGGTPNPWTYYAQQRQRTDLWWTRRNWIWVPPMVAA
jgi:hypothetical protein